MKITKADVAVFERVVAQLGGLRIEMAMLSKSKPDNAVNVFKLEFVNEKLAEANTLLTGDYQPFKSFTLFDPGKLPSNSDVVIVLSQYLTCLETWHSAHVYYNDNDYKWHWRLNDGDLEATEPTSHGSAKRL